MKFKFKKKSFLERYDYRIRFKNGKYRVHFRHYIWRIWVSLPQLATWTSLNGCNIIDIRPTAHEDMIRRKLIEFCEEMHKAEGIKELRRGTEKGNLHDLFVIESL